MKVFYYNIMNGCVSAYIFTYLLAYTRSIACASGALTLRKIDENGHEKSF